MTSSALAPPSRLARSHQSAQESLNFFKESIRGKEGSKLWVLVQRYLNDLQNWFNGHTPPHVTSLVVLLKMQSMLAGQGQDCGIRACRLQLQDPRTQAIVYIWFPHIYTYFKNQKNQRELDWASVLEERKETLRQHSNSWQLISTL